VPTTSFASLPRQFLLCLGGHALGGIFYTLVWWPITLHPFKEVLAGFFWFYGSWTLIPPLLLLVLSRPVQLARLAALATFLLRKSLFAIPFGLFLGAMHIRLQIRAITANPFLTLSQYMREQIWVLWIAMAILPVIYMLVIRAQAILLEREVRSESPSK
jgi:hypothetical protein